MQKSFITIITALSILQGCASGIREKASEPDKKDAISLINKTENINMANNSRARWVSSDFMLWEIPPSVLSYNCYLYYSPENEIVIENERLKSGKEVKLSFAGVFDTSDPLFSKFPYLKGSVKIDTSVLKEQGLIPEILKSNAVIVIKDSNGNVADATRFQPYGVLDELYTYNEDDLGISFSKSGNPVLKLWAPTARSVKVHIFDKSESKNAVIIKDLVQEEKGVWKIEGENSWINKFYLYEVEVFVPSTNKFEQNIVTDPYSVSLSVNSRKSQIIDIDSPELKPEGWDSLKKPVLKNIQDISVYELHVRDFSASDKTVSPNLRGKYLAFTEKNSNGMKHLHNLAKAGLTHIHLLPVADMATVQEDRKLQFETIIQNNLPPDSDMQQSLVGQIRDNDAFNWGYDPFHYGVPEGSYSIDPDGNSRILEFRKMVKSLSESGLRLVVDVVYNHTHSAGQDSKSVLDKIVPGYYYRLDKSGNVQSSSCCPDTASEHNMMEKLMKDTLKIWAKYYKVDGFRFDLMGHHTKDNLRNIKHELNSLTPEKDGVDGSKIYLYGEGWRFGSLNDILPDQAMYQQNAYGLGIGTFNDRIRDSLRGGNFSHDTKSDQGFIDGLYYDYNNAPENTDTPKDLTAQKKLLLNYTDNIKIGMAGNLRDYTFTSADSKLVKGCDINYRGSLNSGYTAGPSEVINYVEAHDNYSLWDQITAKSPFGLKERKPHSATPEEKARMQNLGLSVIALSQGITFFHAGSDMLRSKSGDGDSYDSGDWFNVLDFTYQTNNWGVGLPPAWRNKNEWSFWKPRLADKSLKPSREVILSSVAHFQRMLRIRKSSELFHLTTAKDIMERVKFIDHENKSGLIPGLIVMTISDDIKDKKAIDPERKSIIALINATKETVKFSHDALKSQNYKLFPDLADDIYIETSSGSIFVPQDTFMKKATFDIKTGTFSIPPRTTLVYFQPRKK